MVESVLGLLGVIIAMVGVAVGLLVRTQKTLDRIEALLEGTTKEAS